MRACASCGRESSDDKDAQIGLRRVRAVVLAHEGDCEAVEIAEQTDFLELRGRVFADLASVLELAGQRGDAVAALERALAEFERKGHIPGSEQVRGRQAELAAARG